MFRSSTARGTLSAWLAAVAAMLVMSAAWLWKDPGFFWHCDSQLWYSPIYEETVRAWKAGEWPILSACSWTTASLAGEYQVGTFSVFHQGLLLLIWSAPWTMAAKTAVLSLVYMAVLSGGTVLLVRRRGAEPGGAALAGLVAAANGWLLVWGASQWLVALYGFAWVPWCWWAWECAQESPSPRVRWLAPVPWVYLVFSSGSPFAVLLLCVLGAWLLLKFQAAGGWRATAPLLTSSLLGVGLAAPAWLALIDYHHFSHRAGWGALWQWNWRVPFSAWLGLIFPAHRTPWATFWGEWEEHTCVEFAGGFVPVAILVAAAWRHPRGFLRRRPWELALLAAVIVLASIPMLGSFRWSFRNLPLFFLTLGVLAADCLPRIKPVTAALTGFLLLAGASMALRGEIVWPAVYVQVLLAALWLLIAWWAARRGLRWLTAWLPFAVSVLLLGSSFCLLPTTQNAFVHPFRENLLSPAPLDPQRLYLGVWSFPDLQHGVEAPPAWGAALRPCNLPLLGGLRFLNGYSSFSLQGVPAFFEPFGSLSEHMATSLLAPECAPLLDLLGVDGLDFGPSYFARTAALGPEWRLVHDSAEAKIYHREPARFAAAKTLPQLDDRPGLVLAQPQLTVVNNGRQTVTVQIMADAAGEPGLAAAEDIGLVDARSLSSPIAVAFARPYLPGYVAKLNGQAFPVRNYVDLVPLVELPPGSQGRLDLVYRPGWMVAGAVLSLLSLLTVIAAWLLLRTSMRNRGLHSALANLPPTP